MTVNRPKLGRGPEAADLILFQTVMLPQAEIRSRAIPGQLDRLGIRVGARTVARLLDKLHFSLRVHCKKIAAGNRSTRDQQSATLPGCAVDSVVTAIPSSV